MKTIYIDSEFKCHITNPDKTFKAVQTNFFNGKCDLFIEGYRFVPKGEKWISNDGTIFHGEMVTPWKDYYELDSIQIEYERQQFIEYNEILSELGVEI
jgi:hypothetical protein